MCPKCGYTYLDPPIPSAALTQYYTNQSRWPSETIAYKEQMAFIEPFLQGKPRVLDVGAYDGRLLGMFAERGASALYGIEPDQGVEMVSAPQLYSSMSEAWFDLGENSIDVITLGHVFEHLQNPLHFLEQAKSLLVPGGLLFIEVPDLEDPQIQMVPYWTPFHHSYFTPPTLTYMLEVGGFDVKALDRTGYRAVRAIARNFSNRVPNWDQAPPPHSARAGIVTYVQGRADFLEQTRDRLFSLYPDTLAIFGTGDHTEWLLREFPDLLKHTECFLSSIPELKGQNYRSKPILSPSETPDTVDTVICSSYDSQNEMAQIIGKRAFLLYDDVRAYDVWMGDDDEV
jgi:SAM-dependent methyltransferase